MKRLLAVITGALALVPAAAGAAPRPDARAWLVENAATGEVLAAHAAAARMPIASITKLMTVLVTLDHARPAFRIVVDPGTPVAGEASAGLRKGDVQTIGKLVEAALVYSANDAARALARNIGKGSEAAFVRLMNERARELGLHDTRFVNPTGHDAPGQVSSARDVTRLAKVAMRKPLIRRFAGRRFVTISGRRFHTWNDLLGGFPGVVGVKTGHTEEAGWSQVAAARGPGVTIYATILGGPTRDERNADLAALLAWGLSRFRVVEAIDDDRTYATARVGWGRSPVRLVAAGPLRRAIRIDRPLVEEIVAPAVASLPVERGQRLGAVRVYYRGKLLGERPLVAAESRTAPGMGGKIRWYATRTLENAWGVIF